MRREIFEPDPSEVELTSEDRTDVLFSYLKVLFRDKNRLLKVRINGVESQISEKIIPYALLQGKKSGQIEFHWHSGRWINPRVALQNKPEGSTIHVHFSKLFYENIENGFTLLLPLGNAAYEDAPETRQLQHIWDIANGKADYELDPHGFATTPILEGLLTKVYGMWRELP